MSTTWMRDLSIARGYLGLGNAAGGREQIHFGAYPVHERSGDLEIPRAGRAYQHIAAFVFHGAAGGNEGAAVDLIGDQAPTSQPQAFAVDGPASTGVRILV